ncbi:MAG: 3-carboxy-cis,cis-muconate cycloisomerase [Sphingobium sp.]|nr:MAG: 3-carboxy-cis,cis-muconate cycloisomerase [Sphingobium sp.]
MSDLLRSRPASTAEMMAVFSDQSTLRHALAFEAALAAAEAEESVIAVEMAEAIIASCRAIAIDPMALAEEAALAGTLAIPLVKRLRATLPPQGAGKVHHGATSQDMADSILMLQTRDAAALLLRDAGRICDALASLAQRHAATPAIGRTLLQDAIPVGFGLRLAQAAKGIDEARSRLAADVATFARLQFGGAAGTRAGLHGKGCSIAERMAQELGLASAEPWHARRVGTAAIATGIGILIGSVAKLARDISLLAQNTVGEAREPVIAGRGGSSAMAHKRNPTGCQVALAAAARAPGLVSAILGAMAQEEERGLGGWQAEGPVIADLFLIAAGALAAMATVAEGLDIDEGAIAANLSRADVGMDIGESEAIVTALLKRQNQE